MVFPTNCCYPRFDLNEIKLGKALGKGAFAKVYEIKRINISKGSSGNESPEVNKCKAIMVNLCNHQHQQLSGTFGSKGKGCFALKQLHRPGADDENDPQWFARARLDMATETRLLTTLQHPNIVELRGVGAPECNFIIVDRLYGTLEERLREWDARSTSTSGLAGRLLDRKGTRGAALYQERMRVAADLAGAFAYVHKCNIIYRDIKPANVGFDASGKTKLFDFGLAKELRDSDRNRDGTYNLTSGSLGAIRYRAPEVANERPYGQSADCYSFAMLLWEIMELEPPFEYCTPNYMHVRVHNGPHHKRPKINKTWSEPIKQVLQKSWSHNSKHRMTMAEMCKALQNELDCTSSGDGSTNIDKNSKTMSRAAARRGTVESSMSRQRQQHKTATRDHRLPLAPTVIVFAEGGAGPSMTAAPTSRSTDDDSATLLSSEDEEEEEELSA